jgi:hypothetical protein
MISPGSPAPMMGAGTGVKEISWTPNVQSQSPHPLLITKDETSDASRLTNE